MKIYIVIPTYNEKENVEKLIGEIFDLKINDLKIIVVDDNSPDNTGKQLDKLTKQYPLTIIHRVNKQGIGSAYLLGFNEALKNKADIIFQMDADLSHDPQEIPNFIKAIENGAEVVIGSRRINGGKITGWSPWRHFCSLMASNFSRRILNLNTKDITSGYRCYQRRVLEKINIFKIKSDGYAFFEEITYLLEKNKILIKEIPIIFKDRFRGQSKLNYKEIIEFFKTIARLKIKNKTYEKNINCTTSL